MFRAGWLTGSSCSSREALETRSGLHTYVGCSVEARTGLLRVVSYINPRPSHIPGAAVGAD